MAHKKTVETDNIKVVILAGMRDFGRCPVSSSFAPALWPVVEQPALVSLLRSLARQGIKRAVVCSNDNAQLLEKTIAGNNSIQVDLVHEHLPAGTAGCVREANKITDNEADTLFVILPAGITAPPKIDALIKAHRQGQSDMTIMFNPANGNGQQLGQASGIYICEQSVLEHIPKDGYFDIKESLIPKMLKAGNTIHAATLAKDLGNFRNRQEYLSAIGYYLDNGPSFNVALKNRGKNGSGQVWSAENTKIDPTARIYGPVVIMDGALISQNSVIFGPAVLGRNTSIGQDTIVVNSVLWDNARIGANCQVQRCLLDHHCEVANNTIVQEESIAFVPQTLPKKLGKPVLTAAKTVTAKLAPALDASLVKMNEKLLKLAPFEKKQWLWSFASAMVLIAFFWSYWPNLIQLWHIWLRSEEFSSGILVPFLAVYILWSRRRDFSKCHIEPCIRWGIPVLVIAQGFHLFGLYFMYSSAEWFSIGVSIAALVLLLFGWQVFKKVFTVLLFMFLMLPWPNRIQNALSIPLQHWATSSAVFCLELLGYEVVQEGNILHIGQTSVAVAEACYGLRMITAFFVVTGLVVLLVKRTRWEKLIVILSSLPIALLCNTTRLVVTAIVFTMISGQYLEKTFHDFGELSRTDD